VVCVGRGEDGDRNSDADDAAHARIAAAATTANTTAGCRNTSNGARVHGGSD
jgi:hypothetical protein